MQSDDKTLTLGRRRVLFKVQGKLTSPSENRSRQQLTPNHQGLNTGINNNPINLISYGTIDTTIDQPQSNPMTIDVQQKSVIDKADQLYKQIDKIVANNQRLLDPLEKKIQKEIFKRQQSLKELNAASGGQDKGDTKENIQQMKHVSRLKQFKERGVSRGDASCVRSKVVELDTDS